MSQREAYQYSSSTGAQTGTGFDYGSASTALPKVQYVCGECATKVQLDKEDKIRCASCGHRVLYKERTKRMVQFEAR